MSLPKLKFVILSGDIGKESTQEGNGMNTGGYVVLHELARILESLGMEVKMFITGEEKCTDVKNIKNNIFNKFIINPYGTDGGNLLWYDNLIDGKNYESGRWCIMNSGLTSLISKYRFNKKCPSIIDDDTIVIYSETVPGNVLNAKNVVRWILADINTFSLNKNIIPTWSKDDLIFHNSNMNNNDTNILSISWVNPIFKKNRSKNKKSGSCHMFRKLGIMFENNDNNISQNDIVNKFNNITNMHPKNSTHFEGDGAGSSIIRKII